MGHTKVRCKEPLVEEDTGNGGQGDGGFDAEATVEDDSKVAAADGGGDSWGGDSWGKGDSWIGGVGNASGNW